MFFSTYDEIDQECHCTNKKEKAKTVGNSVKALFSICQGEYVGVNVSNYLWLKINYGIGIREKISLKNVFNRFQCIL